MKQGSLVTVVPMWASKGWGKISSLFSWAQRASKWWMVTFGLTSLDPTYPLSNVLTHSFKSWKQLSIAENVSINHLPSVKRGNASSNHTPQYQLNSEASSLPSGILGIFLRLCPVFLGLWISWQQSRCGKNQAGHGQSVYEQTCKMPTWSL